MFKVLEGRWEGLDTLGDDALLELRPRAERAVVDATLHFVNELKKTLTGARTGKVYRVSRTGRMHTASAPGEPPAVLYGNLRNSAGRTQPRWEGDTVEAEVGIGLGTKPAGGEQDPAETYARRLELGGSDARGVHILPRPYMEPTALRTEPRIQAILEGA